MRKLFLLVVLALSVSTAFAGSVTYTDWALWFIATLPGDHLTFGPGETLGSLAVDTTTGSFGAPRGVFPAGTNVWNDRVTVAGDEMTLFSEVVNPQIPFYAFGGFWDFSPAGPGQGLTLTLFFNGDSFNICGNTGTGCPGGVLVPDGTFFGVITTSPFFFLGISADGQSGVAETFDLKGLDMVRPTPEPATMVLLGAGLLGFGLLRRTRA